MITNRLRMNHHKSIYLNRLIYSFHKSKASFEELRVSVQSKIMYFNIRSQQTVEISLNLVLLATNFKSMVMISSRLTRDVVSKIIALRWEIDVTEVLNFDGRLEVGYIVRTLGLVLASPLVGPWQTNARVGGR